MFVYFKAHFYSIEFLNILSSWKSDSTFNCTHSDLTCLTIMMKSKSNFFLTVQNVFCFEYFFLIWRAVCMYVNCCNASNACDIWSIVALESLCDWKRLKNELFTRLIFTVCIRTSLGKTTYRNVGPEPENTRVKKCLNVSEEQQPECHRSHPSFLRHKPGDGLVWC